MTESTLDPETIVYATVDSLRYDHVTDETMPYLTTLADEGVWFDQMISCAPATAASFVALMASRYYSDVEGIGLPDEEFSTLAESLSKEYRTVGRSTNHFTSTYYNYDRGFDVFRSPSQGWKFKIRKVLDEEGPLFRTLEWAYHHWLQLTSDTDSGTPSYFNAPAHRVNAAVRDRMSEGVNRPTFAWIHYMDPHHPYEPPAEYLPDSVPDRTTAQYVSREIPGVVPENRADDLQRCTDLYAAECRQWDDAFEAFHESLPEDTLVIVVGDHGELLGEHQRLGHPHEMWEELVHVPCLIHHPDLPDATIRSQQSTLDIAPTILDLVGQDVPRSMRGTPIALSSPAEREYAFGTIETPDHVGMVRTPDEKWIRHLSRRSTQDDHGELLVNPADEAVDAGQARVAAQPDRAAAFESRFEAELDGERAPARRLEDQSVRQHMADLGYLDQV